MEGSAPEHSFGVFYKARVRDLMSQALATCGIDTSVQEMARLMRERHLGSVIILGPDSLPLGIVTERDLVYKVVADGEGPEGDPGRNSSPLTAGDIMSSPLITVTPEDHLYEALYLMMKHRCRRLVVLDAAGQLAGFLSMRHLLGLQGYEAGVIAGRIDKAPDITALSELRPEIDQFLHKLFLSDVDGRSLAEILTDFNDAITRRVIAINVRKLRQQGHPHPQVPYAWVCFGSEGRQEQVLRGDQDNGMILGAGGETKEVREYFRRLAAGVNEDLASYGFYLCAGGVMAREDQYFGTLKEWQERVFATIHSVEDGKHLRDLTIFLDLRHLEGDGRLTDELWAFTRREIQKYPPVLRALADDAVTKATPLNFLGRLQYEKDRQGKRGINVKKFGMLPLVAGVKAMAIEREVRATATAERIRGLEAMGAIEHETAANLLFANNLFLKLKLETSLEKALRGRDAGHFFYPDEWSEWERQDLKRAFKAVDYLHNILKFHFVL